MRLHDYRWTFFCQNHDVVFEFAFIAPCYNNRPIKRYFAEITNYEKPVVLHPFGRSLVDGSGDKTTSILNSASPSLPKALVRTGFRFTKGIQIRKAVRTDPR